MLLSGPWKDVSCLDMIRLVHFRFRRRILTLGLSNNGHSHGQRTRTGSPSFSTAIEHKRVLDRIYALIEASDRSQVPFRLASAFCTEIRAGVFWLHLLHFQCHVLLTDFSNLRISR